MATMTSMSSVEFSQDTGRARQLAKKAPVFIIDHGETSHVLLSIEECQKLARQGKSIPTSWPWMTMSSSRHPGSMTANLDQWNLIEIEPGQ
jgi:hypothetical protein